MSFSVRTFLRQFDWLLFGSLVILVAIGLLLLYSTSLGREAGNLATFWKQLAISVVGLFILLGLSVVDFHTWDGVSRFLYGAALVVLMVVLAIGITVNGHRGWISIAGLTIQPVEFAKAVAVLALASYFARRSRTIDRLPYLLQSLGIVAVLIALILFQPDLGSAALIFALWVGLVLVIGVRREYLIAFLVIGVATALLAWFVLLRPYQKDRIRTFLFPQQQTDEVSYNVRQATIAVGSGELTGRGLGQGSQSQLKFLPEATTDFMFATVAEELGFAGVAVVFFLLAIIFYRLVVILRRCQDNFASFVVLGTILLLLIEIWINAGMNMGLFPVVGIPFPFLSAGGSALLAHLVLLGIVENIARFEGGRGYRLSGAAAV